MVEVFNADVTFSDGSATVEDITLNHVGDHDLTVDVTGVTDDVVVKDVTVEAADQSGFDLAMDEDPITEGDTAQVNVTNAQDAAGDAISSAAVAVTITSDQAEDEVFNDNVDFSGTPGAAQIMC